MPSLPRAPEGAARTGHNQFGELPVWDLSDLYSGNQAPALVADLERAKAEAKAFEQA